MPGRLPTFWAFLLACALTPVCTAAQTGPLVVGWHDEFSRPVAWAATAPGGADISQRRGGTLTLTLGPTAVFDPNTFAWASVSRDVEVDLNAYPILAVRALRVSPDCLPERGLILFDIRAHLRQCGLSDAGSGGRQRLRLRLNVAGLKRGGSVDYAWARCVRREDAERLRRQPDLQAVLLAP